MALSSEQAEGEEDKDQIGRNGPERGEGKLRRKPCEMAQACNSSLEAGTKES